MPGPGIELRTLASKADVLTTTLPHLSTTLHSLLDDRAGAIYHPIWGGAYGWCQQLCSGGLGWVVTMSCSVAGVLFGGPHICCRSTDDKKV